MSDAEEFLRKFNERYARNLIEAHVLLGCRAVMVGLGAQGSLVAYKVVHQALGTLDLLDWDVVTAANQSRHVLSDPKYIGQAKASALASHLRRELPQLQRIRSIVADVTELSAAQLEALLTGADLIIAATGRDEVDRLLNRWARRLRIPILVPSMWSGERAVLGDLLVVPWNLPGRRGACFECLRPERRDAPAPAEAQPGLRSHVERVATLTAETAVALLLREGPQHAQLMRQLEGGVNYFLVPRWPPTVRTVRTSPRRGCPACSTAADTTGTTGLLPTEPREWAITAALASAVLWHQLVPGLDAIATVALIAGLLLWSRNRLASVDEVSARIRRLFGTNR